MLKRSIALAAALAALVAPAAHASQLIDRNATGVKLQVNQNQALLSYRVGSAAKHVLAWGAINARPPDPVLKQYSFHLNYAGFGFQGGACKPYTGQSLPWVVAACDGPDGSHWVAQAFPQPLPDLGFDPWTSSQKAVWLELSHWLGSVPQLTVGQDWVYSGRYREIYGQMMYMGKPVYGFKTTHFGAPLGGYGSLVYLDVLNAPAYGQGWHRENSFVTHKGTGGFCYGFFTFNPTTGGYVHPPGQTAMRGPGVGDQYRLTAHGPGVAPDVGWTGTALGAYDASNPQDQQIQQEGATQIKGWGDTMCLAGH